MIEKAQKVEERWIDDQMFVAKVQYQRIEGTTITICVVTLTCGFHLIGHSACVDPDDFDKELGEQLAFNKARSELWALEGYRRMKNADEPS